MKLKNSYDYFYLLFNELIRVKIRTGRLEKEMTDEAAVYTSSLEFDRFIFDADIQCNYAHTSMLKAQGIIDESLRICSCSLCKESNLRSARIYSRSAIVMVFP